VLEPQRAGPSAEALPGAGEGELRNIAYAETLQEAEQRRRSFQSWARGEGLQRAAELIEEDWERMVSYYGYPRAHWRHLRTTNVIESPFAALRLRTDAAKRFKKVAIRHGGDLEDAVGG
jgi:transposase-like protein